MLNQELQKQINELTDRETREQELLIAQFIKQFPDIPIEEIVLVREQRSNSIRIRVSTRDALRFEDARRERLKSQVQH